MDREGFGKKKMGSPARHGEEMGGARWKKGNGMWQNIDFKKWIHLSYKS